MSVPLTTKTTDERQTDNRAEAPGRALPAGAAPSLEAALAVCPTCQQQTLGEFCLHCCEKRLDQHDLSLKHFARRALHEITDFENSKTFRTFKALLFKPGRLTNEYLAGRRSLYLTPIKIFLLTFGLNLFLMAASRAVPIYDFDLMIREEKTGSVAQFVERRARRKGVEKGAFVEKVSTRVQSYATWLQPLAVAGISLALAFLYWGTRRYFVEHLVFSLHFLSFAFILGIVFLPSLMMFGIGFGFTSVLSIALLAFYLFTALRTVYREAAGKTILKMLLLVGVYYLAIITTYSVTFLIAFLQTAL